MQANAAQKTVVIKVVADYNDNNGGYNFDGAANGAMLVQVPTGWRVTLDFLNKSLFSHSLAVVANANTTQPAFSGAGLSPNALSAGIGQNQSATIQFVAGAPGNYRLACLVPSHEADGMWERFVITPKGGSPAVSFPG